MSELSLNVATEQHRPNTSRSPLVEARFSREFCGSFLGGPDQRDVSRELGHPRLIWRGLLRAVLEHQFNHSRALRARKCAQSGMHVSVAAPGWLERAV